MSVVVTDNKIHSLRLYYTYILDKGFLDLSESHFFGPSFWCVSIAFEVH